MTTAATTAGRAAAPGLPVSRRGLLRAMAKLGRGMLLLLAAAGLLAIRNPTSITHYAVGFALCIVAVAGTIGLRRDAASMVAYLVAFAAFAYVRAVADETGIPVQFDYVIALERALPGPLMNVWLQGQLWSPDSSVLNVSMVVVHLSYFFVPHATALALWRWRRALVSRYVLAMLLTFYLSVLLCALVPTAPPWMASEAALIPEVVKVSDWVLGQANVDGYTTEVARMNPVAAMPSLHFAMTVIAAAGLAAFGRSVLIGAIAYAVVMGFALVYMGEHWMVDLAGGVLLAALAWWGAKVLASALNGRRWSLAKHRHSEETGVAG